MEYRYFARIVMEAFCKICKKCSVSGQLYADFQTASEIAQKFTKSCKLREEFVKHRNIVLLSIFMSCSSFCNSVTFLLYVILCVYSTKWRQVHLFF
jgi:hypothetical protein